MEELTRKIEALCRRGVIIPDRRGVVIGPEVRIERISGKVTLFSGTKIFGAETYIGEGSVIAFEGPVTIDDCQIGCNVNLNGGFFSRAVFLNGVKCGSGSHVREGTILEEHASIAHTVGLKQTILFPYVTLGSLINFCDCLMAGGRGPKDHSEVGSSYIHFNFTANQDKATPSLIGDVPRGVLLDQAPVFLGGQGGMVGPCRIAFGTVTAAGTIIRKDQLQPDRLVFEGAPRDGSTPFKPGGFRNLRRTLINNYIYIANLLALEQWYRNVRALFTGPAFPQELLHGLCHVLDLAIAERIKQIRVLSEKVGAARRDGLQFQFIQNRGRIEDRIAEVRKKHVSDPAFDSLVGCIQSKNQGRGGSYLETIRSLNADEAGSATAWLNGGVKRLLVQVDLELPLLKVFQAWQNE